MAAMGSYTARGNCSKKLPLGAPLPRNPSTHSITDVTRHWNQVTVRGAGILDPSVNINLFKNTREMDTTGRHKRRRKGKRSRQVER